MPECSVNSVSLWFGKANVMSRIIPFGFLCVLIAALAAPPPVCAADWPMLQGNPARTGYTDDTVQLPAKVLWQYDAREEQVSRHVQAIISDGRAYLPTHAGNLHCVDAATGKLLWKYNVGSPIMHSPACGSGLVVTGCYDGAVVALSAEGKQVWRTPTKGPVWASPLIYKSKVFIGDRLGVFYALDLATGEVLWTYDVGAPIMLSASALRSEASGSKTADGRLYLGGEDCVLRCLDAGSGDEIWKSAQLGGAGFRSYWPVVTGGKVIVGTMRAQAFNIGIGRDRAFLDQHADLLPTRRGGEQARHEDLQPFIIEWLSKNPNDQTLFFLNASDGKTFGIPPALALAGHGTAYPPVAVGKDGTIYLEYCLFRVGESQPAALGWVDFTGDGIRFHEFCHGGGTSRDQRGLFVAFNVTDISQLLIVGGDKIFGRGAQGISLGAFDLKTRQPMAIGHGRVSVARPSYSVFRTNGGTDSPLALANNKLFLVDNSSMVCIGAPSKAPSTPKGK